MDNSLRPTITYPPPRYRPIVNQVQEELWKNGTYPPRTIIEVQRLNQDDIVEVEGTFYLGSGAKYV